jgi:hypothetical protein
MTYKHTLVAGLTPSVGTVPPTLTELCQAVCRNDRNLKTMPRNPRSAWVYAEGELFVRGWVGWGDFQTTQHGDNKFVVCARDIENNKYSAGSETHHMKMSVAMETVLKTAKRHLVKYTTREVEVVFRPTVQEKLRSVFNTLQNKKRSLAADLGISGFGRSKDKLVRELKLLAMSAHRFEDPQFAHNLQEHVDVSEALDAIPDTVPMDFVHIYPTPWETRADVLDMKNVAVDVWHVPLQLTWVADELPDSVMGKIAVLQMCIDEQYVEGVGMRINEHTFYLHKESDDTWK